MSHENDFGAPFPKQSDCRQTFPDPRIVGDDRTTIALLGGHVKIYAQKNAFASNIKVSD
jgi:hypothetical protein